MAASKTMTQKVTPRNVSLLNLLRAQPALIPDLPQIVSGLFKLITLKPTQATSIGQLLEHQAQRFPDNLLLIDENNTLTYSQTNQQVNRIAHLLHKQGITSGDVVGLFLENRNELLLAALATLKLGAVAAMFNTTQRQDVLVHSLKTTTPKLLVIGEELTDALSEIQDKILKSLKDNLWFVGDNSESLPAQQYKDLFKEAAKESCENIHTVNNIHLHQPAFYVFTSGTTGMPKASIMSHFRWFKAMAGIGTASLRIQQTDTVYCPLPLYHNNALSLAFSAALGNGASIAITRKFSVKQFWQDVRKYNATAFCYIGELCRYLYNQPPQSNDKDNSIRLIFGNGLRPSIWMEFKERFNILHINEFYGASEVNLMFSNGFNLDYTAGFCPLPHAIVKWDVETDQPITNKNGKMQKACKGETGLLLAKVTSKNPFDGYTSDSASEKKLFRDVFKNGDCYINTGDLVINQGLWHIAFADRLGDTFRWKGENVASAEVENVLSRFPNIEQAAVYGVDIPGIEGKAGMAALVLRNSLADFNFKDFTSYMLSELPKHAVPLFLRIQKQQQVTTTFKHQKGSLKRESFNIDTISEPVLVLLPNETSHHPLTSELLNKISNQEIRF